MKAQALLQSPSRGRNVLWIEDANGCYLWIRARAGKNAHKGLDKGYGCLRIDGILTPAHRAMWEAVNGPIPHGMHILHQCDVTLCVNDAHHKLGTNAENQEEKAVRGLAPSKISAADAAEIRRRVAAGEYQRVVGTDFGLSQPTVSEIVNRKYWRHVG